MSFFNHYSVVIVGGLLTLAGLAMARRCGWTARGWWIVAGLPALYAAGWLVVRPVADRDESPAPGLPVLLEVQSPLCLGCVAVKPAVDRLEQEWRGRLIVRRVDIQSPAGRELSRQHRIEFTPTFILFDAAGAEQWRGVGRLDAAQVQALLGERG